MSYLLFFPECSFHSSPSHFFCILLLYCPIPISIIYALDQIYNHLSQIHTHQHLEAN